MVDRSEIGGMAELRELSEEYLNDSIKRGDTIENRYGRGNLMARVVTNDGLEITDAAGNLSVVKRDVIAYDELTGETVEEVVRVDFGPDYGPDHPIRPLVSETIASPDTGALEFRHVPPSEIPGLAEAMIKMIED